MSVRLPRHVATTIRDALADKGLTFDALDAAIAADIPWHLCAEAIGDLRSHLSDAEIVHAADQSAGAFADYFTAVGLDLRDERVLFEVIVTLALVRNVGFDSHCKGITSHEEYAAVVTMLRSVAAVLTVLAPRGT